MILGVYLQASRRSAMWFVDVHSHELPPAGSIFMEHLWHKDSTERYKRHPANCSNYWTSHIQLAFGSTILKHLWSQRRAEG